MTQREYDRIMFLDELETEEAPHKDTFWGRYRWGDSEAVERKVDEANERELEREKAERLSKETEGNTWISS